MTLLRRGQAIEIMRARAIECTVQVHGRLVHAQTRWLAKHQRCAPAAACRCAATHPPNDGLEQPQVLLCVDALHQRHVQAVSPPLRSVVWGKRQAANCSMASRVVVLGEAAAAMGARSGAHSSQ